MRHTKQRAIRRLPGKHSEADRKGRPHRRPKGGERHAVRGGAASEACEVVRVTVTSGPSRLSMTNRADSETGGERAGVGRTPNVPLTERDGVTLREEVRDWGALDGDRATGWRDSVFSFRDYLRDKEDVATVFENGETGEQASSSSPHRFAPEYADTQYAKLKDLERGIGEAYGCLLYTLTLPTTPYV